jgi:hypothetical protein
VLLVLFAPPAPIPNLRQLAAAQPTLSAARLRIRPIGLSPAPGANSEDGPPLIVGVSPEAPATLALSSSADDRGETELLLDRAVDIRARRTLSMPGGLSRLDTVAMPAARIAQTVRATVSIGWPKTGGLRLS